MKKDSRIFVAGHNGLVGSAIIRQLMKEKYCDIITRHRDVLDLTVQSQVDNFFECEKPEYVFLAAAKVGGIYSNSNYPAEFIYNNLQIQCNVINACYRYDVKKLLFLGSSCIYPKHCPQPITEDMLLSSKLEPTNEPYAIAKIAGIRMCQAYNKQYNTNFISCMPTNLYGPGDNYHPENSHVLPALLYKFHNAKIYGNIKVNVWGTGNVKREFLYVDDLADACIFLMNNYNDSEIINIGSGEEINIKDLAIMIARDVVGYRSKINFDPTKPDGTPRKLIDSSKIHKLGWNHKISLKNGIKDTYEHFLKN